MKRYLPATATQKTRMTIQKQMMKTKKQMHRECSEQKSNCKQPSRLTTETINIDVLSDTELEKRQKHISFSLPEKIIAPFMENIIECKSDSANFNIGMIKQISKYINMGNIAFEDKKLVAYKSGRIGTTRDYKRSYESNRYHSHNKCCRQPLRKQNSANIKHGYEIWNILKIPRINPIETLLYHQKTLKLPSNFSRLQRGNFTIFNTITNCCHQLHESTPSY